MNSRQGNATPMRGHACLRKPDCSKLMRDFDMLPAAVRRAIANHPFDIAVSNLLDAIRMGYAAEYIAEEIDNHGKTLIRELCP